MTTVKLTVIELKKNIQVKVINGNSIFRRMAFFGNKNKKDLFKCAVEGDLEGLKKIIEVEKFDIDETDDDGWTALHHSCWNGKNQVVLYLLETGAKIDAKKNYGQTPLHLASYKGHEETVKLLLERGANIDAKDMHGKTPLHLALSQGHLETVKLLLERGANIVAKDKFNQTPLHLASSNGHL